MGSRPLAALASLVLAVLGVVSCFPHSAPTPALAEGPRYSGNCLVRIWVLVAIAGTLLLVGTMAGCGVGGGNPDGRGGEREGAGNEGAAAPGGERTASGAAGEPAGLNVEAVTPGGAYVPAGFGEGSLWATDPGTCNDTMSASGSASSSGGASFPSTIVAESSAQAMCALPNKTLLKRLDPRTD